MNVALTIESRLIGVIRHAREAVDNDGYRSTLRFPPAVFLVATAQLNDNVLVLQYL